MLRKFRSAQRTTRYQRETVHRRRTLTRKLANGFENLECRRLLTCAATSLPDIQGFGRHTVFRMTGDEIPESATESYNIRIERPDGTTTASHGFEVEVLRPDSLDVDGDNDRTELVSLGSYQDNTASPNTDFTINLTNFVDGSNDLFFLLTRLDTGDRRYIPSVSEAESETPASTTPYSLFFDDELPTASLSAIPASGFVNDTISFGGRDTQSGLVSVNLTDNGNPVTPQPFTDCPTNQRDFEYDFGSQDGNHVIVVTVTDKAGNPPQSATQTYMFDATAPTTPSNIVRSGPANAPTFTFSDSTDVTSGIGRYEIQFNDNDDAKFVPIGNNTTFNATEVSGAGLRPGTNTVFIRAVDNAGNASAAIESAPFAFVNETLSDFRLVNDTGFRADDGITNDDLLTFVGLSNTTNLLSYQACINVIPCLETDFQDVITPPFDSLDFRPSSLTTLKQGRNTVLLRARADDGSTTTPVELSALAGADKGFLFDSEAPSTPSDLALANDGMIEPPDSGRDAADFISFDVTDLKFTSSSDETSGVISSGVNSYEIRIDNGNFNTIPELIPPFDLQSQFRLTGISEATNRIQLRAVDVAGNASASVAERAIVLDNTQPAFNDLDVTKDGVQQIQLQTIPLPGSALPVPVVVDPRPVIEFNVTDQQFVGVDNIVKVELVDSLTNTVLAMVDGDSRVTIPGENGQFGPHAPRSLNLKSIRPDDPLASGKGYTVFIRATDAAGKVANSDSVTFFLSEVGLPTLGAPGTPVFSELSYIGATVLDPRGGIPNEIVVDQAIPVAYSVNIDGRSFQVLNSITDAAGQTTLTLSDSISVAVGDHVGWLRPWQMAFDKTTQTVWFTMEDGHYLGQFDPSTRAVDIYDVSIGGTAFDPHGVFFDFNTHLTPRVWFVYRNEQSAPVGEVPDQVLRVSYFDIAQRKTFTFDFTDIAGQFILENTGSTQGGGGGGGGGGGTGGGGSTVAASDAEELSTLKVGHAVFVDATGSVWISAENSGTLVELDFDSSPNRGPATLDGLTGRAIAHVVPQSFGPDKTLVNDFQLHGIQTVVDERDRTTYVWMVDGGDRSGDSVERLALLIPGESDNWFEFAIPRVASGLSHMLFTAFDDNETPGIPDDDKLIFTDTGFGFTGSGDGIVGSIDIGLIVRELRQGNDVSTMKPQVHVVQVPTLPGTNSTDSNAAPIQSFVDRGGTAFFVDPQGGLARLALNESFPPTTGALTNGALATTVLATVATVVGTPQSTQITVQETPTLLTQLDVKPDPISGSDPARALDRSQATGIDQYEVAVEALRRDTGEGPFRGAINAANTVYGSIAQSDHLSVTIFAESARRQMSAVVSPLATPAGAITQARMAFQVIRDGSLILTARGDGMIADDQINLLAELSGPNAANFTIAGEAAAVTMPDGTVHVMGRSTSSGVVQYTYTPSGADWEHDDLFNAANWSVSKRDVAGVILAEDTAPGGPLGFTATTTDGHWLAIPIDPAMAVRDLTIESGNVAAARVYSTVGTTQSGNTTFGYGTNQTGHLIEYQINSGGVSVRQIDAQSRETRLLKSVEVLSTDDGVRHVFATDGVSRLVHWQIGSSGVRQENVSQMTADNGQNFGYFPFQQPFTGRVYTYVEPLIEADGTIRVYGTNGGDLVEFTRTPDEQWRVANLTNDTNATFGADGPGFRVPANAVFGGPTGYIDANGGRHILQINGDGEVVEYFTFGDGLFPDDPMAADRINSQNVNFTSGVSISGLSLELPEPHVSTTILGSSLGVQREDVSGEGDVTARDALLIINYIAATSGASGEMVDGSLTEHHYNYDVNGDNQITSLDALIVINYLIRSENNRAAEGETSDVALWLQDDHDKRGVWDDAIIELTSDIGLERFE